jgi:DNA-directed RNA polymerase specialized sigma24 family protein
MELETKALCFGTADVAAIREQVEDSPSFTMMGTPNVLAGVHLLLWRQQKRREQEFEDYKPKPEQRRKGKKAKKETPKPTLRRLVTMDELETRYRTWFNNQSDETWTALWDDAHALFTRIATRDSSEDGRKLQNTDRDVELVNDFLLSVLSALKSSSKIDKFKHYLSRAWKRRRIDALKALKEWDRKHLRDIPTDDEDDDDERAVTYSDAATYQAWQIEQRETPEPTDEERDLERESKLNQIDADLADFAGVWLTGASEKELSSRFNLSRQAVGRRKRKVEKALTVPAAVEVDQ